MGRLILIALLALLWVSPVIAQEPAQTSEPKATPQTDEVTILRQIISRLEQRLLAVEKMTPADTSEERAGKAKEALKDVCKRYNTKFKQIEVSGNTITVVCE